MSNNRDIQREDLKIIRGDWWIPCVLTAPDKTIYSTEKGTTNSLLGDVRTEPKLFENDEGNPVTIKETSIVFRIDDLTRIPQEGENWFVEYPETLVDSGTLKKAAFTPNNEQVGSLSMGYIKVFLQEITA